ncbi:MAG: type II secretion system secretin GspD [Vulcanimicrobiota bacterium]
MGFTTYTRRLSAALTLLLGVCLLLPQGTLAQPPQPPPPPETLINDQMREILRSGTVTLNYENLDIRLLGRVMAELTGRNIVYDQNVQGRITVVSSEPVGPEQAWQIFRIALEKYGFGVVESNGITQILPLKDIRKYAPVVKNPTTIQSGMSVGVLVFENADVNLMQNALRPLLSDIGEIQPYLPGRAIIVTDRAPMVERIATTARYLDQAHTDTLVSTNFPKFAEATEIAPILEELVNPPGIPNDQRTVVRAFKPSNAVLIYGSEAQIKKVKAMLARVDVPEAAPEDVQDPRFYVIPLQNASAEDVAAILSEMLTEKAELQQQRLQNNPRLARQQRAAGEGAAATPDAASTTTAPGGSPEKTPFVSSVVSADIETNSLIFYVSPGEFSEISALVEKLDAPRKQVLVTAVVAEVSLGRLLQTGANFQALTAGGVLSSFRGGVTEEGLLSFLASGNFVIGAAGSGTRTIDINGREVQVPELFGFLSAEKQNSDFNLISAPRILTEDHKEAEINVGNVVPFPTGAQFNAFGQPTVTYDYRDVGIKLLVTPHVSQSDTIKLEIEQEIQEVTDFLEQNLGGTGFTVPLISNRNVRTTITVKDGQTLMIGGLISKRTTKTLRKVPILGDIPLIQNLFRELREEEAKTTLFISLTPHIVEAPAEIERIDRPYKTFLEGDRNPSDHQVEKRPTREGFTSPYITPEGLDLTSAPAPKALRESESQKGISLSDLKFTRPPRKGGQARPSVRLSNGEESSKELLIVTTVTRPDGSKRELRADAVVLKPGDAREILLPPVSFKSGPGVYELDLAVWEGNTLRSRLASPEKITLK